MAGRNDSRVSRPVAQSLRLQAGRNAISALCSRLSQGKLDRGKPEPIMPTTRAEAIWDRGALRRALEGADPATLLLSLVQLTGEQHWLEAAKPHIRGPMNYQEFMPEELRGSVRDRLCEAMIERQRVGASADRAPDDRLLAEMMSVATGDEVASDYVAMMREDLMMDTLASRSL